MFPSTAAPSNDLIQRPVLTWDHSRLSSAIALGTFVVAAEAVGLGCCPISIIRNHAAKVSEILALPDYVFPVAGMTLGWPSEPGYVSLRLPLAATVHRDRFDDGNIRDQIDAYDRRRASVQPYRRQRYATDYETAEFYGWSEDNARQYARPERADFGGFVRGKGFDLK